MNASPSLGKWKAAGCGLLAGFVAGIATTLVMLFLQWKFQIASPLTILGDRLSVLIKPRPFFWIMGKVGGYNHLKQLGVASSMLGQLKVGALGGLIYGLVFRARGKPSLLATLGVFALLPLIASALLLWPVLGTHYGGLPIDAARLLTLLGLLLAFLGFERTLVLGFDLLVQQKSVSPAEYTPGVGRRAFLLGVGGAILAGGAAGIARQLFRIATFGYDGTQYKGAGVQAITPNDEFYCVTKNVVDPVVDKGLWHLEVTGLVQNPRTYRLQDFDTMKMIEQETTLMCISNGLDAGLMSNARWRGIPMVELLKMAGPLAGAAKVRLHSVDNYTDTIPLEKAMSPTTLIAFLMNGEDLPDEHGYPARAIVPGYFGEKSVKWLTRIELAHQDAKGFYEKQGWGPDFIVPTRSRIDVPENETRLKLADVSRGIAVKGVAFGGDRGISRVEISYDDGENWEDAKIDYPGTKLTWALWSAQWKPEEADDYMLVVRATDGDGAVQKFEKDRDFTSGITGFHKIAVHIQA
ncbi:MAG: molybdopterin-dependent oxidoreductase [Verrucomicrobiota bacterium]|nr:molybdopterin-dependent oxidoreductase [Verrucomicrobiota bacterium]